MEAAARATGAHEMIIRLSGGYNHEVSERGRNLPAGQRQLIALARAQLADPAILLLDEATAALDLAAEAAVNHAIGQLTAARTTIVVAHRLTTAARADRIVVLDQGASPRPDALRADRRRRYLRRALGRVHRRIRARRLAAFPSWAAAARLRGRRRKVIVGVNIGKTKVVPAQEAAADYAASTRAVAGVADYVVVNVSSPNTPGLRDLQAVGRLRPVLVAVRDALDASVAERRVPLLVKIAPDLADADVDAVADLALELGLDGIIATNTTISRDGLASSPSEVAAAGAGGLSGPPLRDRALAVLVRLRARAGERLVLIAAGGIETRTTPGNGCGPAPRWCRPTPGSSTADRCGHGACTRSWRAGPGRKDSPRSGKLRPRPSAEQGSPQQVRARGSATVPTGPRAAGREPAGVACGDPDVAIG